MLKYLIESTLTDMMVEQSKLETDNAPLDATDSTFTPAEEKFLGKFDAYGTKHLGIIYSISDIGIREFIARSGEMYNLTPGILLNLLRNSIIKIVPYTGWGRNTDYTLELQLSLDDVKGFGDEDKKEAEKGGGGGGATPPDLASTPEMPTEPPAPEVAWVVRYGDILQESAKITKKLISEGKDAVKSKKIDKAIVDKTRIFNQLPKEYINHMTRIIKSMSRETKTVKQREKMIADVLDMLQVELKLTPKQIQQSFTLHKSQKRLQKYLDLN